MKLHAFIFAAILLAVGVAVNLRGGATSTIRTKAWLVEHTPKTVGTYETRPGPDGSSETYPMDIPQLKAAGIVCRIMTDGVNSIDAVVVHSDRGESFHDPAGCFRAQEWEIVSQKIETIPTKTLSDIHVNSLVIRHRSSSQEMPAVYCFRHERRVFANQSELLKALLFGEILSAKAQEGTMYRFIALSPETGAQELQRYVGEYMDQAVELRLTK